MTTENFTNHASTCPPEHPAQHPAKNQPEPFDYDCLIIGGGISGLTCGLKCLQEGLSCAVISSGMSALHFSSGSIDLLGYDFENNIVFSPFEALPDFIARHPRHPYAGCGPELIREALTFFRSNLAAEELTLNANGDDNHFHITALGTLKPTFFSQKSVFSEEIKAVFESGPDIAIVNFRGFRDFHPELAAANLKNHPFFSAGRITRGEIDLPEQDSRCNDVDRINPGDMRSVDIARIFDTTPDLDIIARKLKTACGRVDFAGLPAFLGIDRHNRIWDELRRATGMLLYEVPTLPPSILGMRLDNALKTRFAALGGVFIAGETVDQGLIDGDRVSGIHTANQGDTLRARCYLLSSGSFFSKGLSSRFEKIEEPVFQLVTKPAVTGPDFCSNNFFSPAGHRFLSAGVVTDRTLRPRTATGKAVHNLFCAGAVLAHYNPIAEGSGGGVAIATGYQAARQMVDYVRGS